MFTGLTEDIAKIETFSKDKDGMTFCIRHKLPSSEIKIGDSISINGVCETVIKKENDLLYFSAMNETLKRTNLAFVKSGSMVNLERAMAANSRFDGHIVTGHIDCVSNLNFIKNDGMAKIFNFSCNTDLIVEKGSITVNGISLTVSFVDKNGFEVSILPHTLDCTNLKYLVPDDKVNIEYDIIGKYIQKFFKKEKKSNITREFLIENGF